MADIKITSREVGETLKLSSGAKHKVELKLLCAFLIETEDVHFHHDSAILLPDYEENTIENHIDHLTGLLVLKTALDYAEANPSHHLLVAGHTDTSGSDDYNIKLSELRAQNVLAVLQGDKDSWLDTTKKKSKTEDYQSILKWLAFFWGWPCDPGEIDNDHGPATDKAVEAFQELATAELEREISVDGDVGPQTWEAIFDCYMLALADLMNIDTQTLQTKQSSLQLGSKSLVGCGESWPISELGQNNYRSATDRRVELVFFEPSDEPQLACHPATGQCLKDQCDLYKPPVYHRSHVPCPTPILSLRELSIELTEILGLYKPGYDDGQNKLSGYEEAYKSEDDAGRIFINHEPRASASTDWETVRKKDSQYIELSVDISKLSGEKPSGLWVKWVWSDPSELPHEAMDAIETDGIDAGTHPIEENYGECDFPNPNSGRGAKWQELETYPCFQTVDEPEYCYTKIVDGKSKVRLHCTNVGGDNFVVYVGFPNHQLIEPGASDQTGLMTMWKRIDIEYRKMDGDVVDLPVTAVPEFFEPCFVQMDFTEAQLTPFLEFLSVRDDDLSREASEYVKKSPQGVFENESKPGWFLLVSACLAAQDVGTQTSETVYNGIANVAEQSYSGGSMGEVLVIDQAIGEDVSFVIFYDGTKRFYLPVWAKDDDTPSAGKTTLYLYGLDYQSDFVPGTGLIGRAGQGGAYDRTDEYYLQHVYANPAGTWTAGGLGFPDQVEIEVKSPGSLQTGGISPSTNYRGDEYFAGKTIIFSKHHSYSDKDGNPKFDDLIATIVHELGHAFGFPHKCGYYTWETPAYYSCAMNYSNSWLYEPGTRNVQWFNTGVEGKHMCARHLDGIRKVHLEENPAMWKWD